MMSIKLAAVLLALVCLFQTSSAFIVKRDATDAGNQQVTLESIQEQLQKAFGDLSTKAKDLAKQINTDEIQNKLKSFNDEVKKFTDDVGTRFSQAASDAGKTIKGAGS